MADGGSCVWQYNGIFLLGEIGTDENLAMGKVGDKTGGDRPEGALYVE